MPSGYMAKFLLMMRLTTFLLFTVIMQVSAGSFAQQITLSERNVPLMKIFDKISNQTGYDFIITTDMLKLAQPVNITAANEPISTVLEKIFNKQPLDYSILDHIVVVRIKEPGIIDRIGEFFSAYNLRGVVLDEKEQPLAGASVNILGQVIGYRTAMDGRFQLEGIKGREILITSFIGYKSDTLQLTGQTSITIRLKPISTVLEEVAIVNTGYQKLQRNQITGSIGKPDMQQFNTRLGNNDIMSRLEGLVAGMSVNPGPVKRGIYGTGDNQQSLIRGVSSVLVSGEPLYVIDGIQVPNLGLLNPNDVEDISVLKDAAAAAIYGAKAANGVIVIVTKAGKKEQQVSIRYNGAFNYQGKPRYRKDYFMNSAQFVQTAREVFDPVLFPESQNLNAYTAPHDAILYNRAANRITQEQANRSLDSLGRINNQDQILDLFFRDGFSTNNTLSATGGGKAYSIYSSLSHILTQSSTPGEKANTFQLLVNQTITPTRWLTIGLNTALNNQITKSKTPVSVGLGFLPYQLFEDEQGNSIPLNYMWGWNEARRQDFQNRSRINLDYYPLQEFNKGNGQGNMLNLNSSTNVGVKLWKGLSFEGVYGYNRSSRTHNSYIDNSLMGQRRELINFTVAPTATSEPIYHLPVAGGKYTVSDVEADNWQLRNQLVFTSTLRKDKDRLSLRLGQEVVGSSNVQNTTIQRGYDQVLGTYSLLDYVKLSQLIFGTVGGAGIFTEYPFTRLAQKTRFLSYYGLFNYAMDEKYFLDASIRYDKSSLFASDESSQNKPAFSIGGKWILHKEEWMPKLNWLNTLGARLTYGVTGNSPFLGAASTFDIINAARDNVLGNYMTVFRKANNKLSWEATHTWNMGLDFSLFGGRLFGTTEVYFKNTKDLLGAVEYNPFTSAPSARGNIGNIKNSGIEVSLTSKNVNLNTFTWSTGFIFSYNHNRLASYSRPTGSASDVNALLSASFRVGYAMPPLFAYRSAGLDALGDPQIIKADGTVTKNPTAARPEDLVYMGTTRAKFNGGISNTFRYKDFSLSANIVYNLGGVMRAPTVIYPAGRITVTSMTSGNLLSSFADRWRQPGDEQRTNIPAYVASPAISAQRRNLSYYYYSDVNVMSSSYLKLRDVTFSYNLSSRFAQAIGVQKVSFSAQTGNFLLWAENKLDIDPELAFGSLNVRNLALGLNVSF